MTSPLKLRPETVKTAEGVWLEAARERPLYTFEGTRDLTLHPQKSGSEGLKYLFPGAHFDGAGNQLTAARDHT